MPQLVDLHKSDDPRDVIHLAVQRLSEGAIVGLPTETGYVLAASALGPNAAGTRPEVGTEQPSGEVLFLKHPLEAVDYVPDLSPLADKLSRRCWPGPVTLRVASLLDQGVAEVWSPELRHQLTGEGFANLRVPHHDVVQAILRLLPAPLIVRNETDAAGQIFRTSEELIRDAGDAVAIVIDDGPSRYTSPATVVQVTEDDWSVHREGVVKDSMLNRLAGRMIVFVCTGNTCRSPMAEGLFRKFLSQNLECGEDELADRGYLIASAGVSATPGRSASDEAVLILRDRGVDLNGHTSQPLTPRLILQADTLVTLTRQHRDVILREFPEAEPRVQLLSREGGDISDPFGGGLDEYARCADEIERHVRKLVRELPAV